MQKAENKEFDIKTGNTLLMGVTKVADGVQFAIALPEASSCILHLYKKGHLQPAASIELNEDYKIGGVFFVVITGLKRKRTSSLSIAEILQEQYEYTYQVGEEEFVDPYAYQLRGRQQWGKSLDKEEKRLVRGGFSLSSFDWESDTPLHIPTEDMILYQLHVRGYTKHSSSGVKHKGTFAGLMEKIPYLKELGINGVMLLPCYDFEEVIYREDSFAGYVKEEPHKTAKVKEEPPVKLNYWGYGAANCCYFAPKSSYAADKNHADREMMEMVKALHKAGIEVIMDMYFTRGTNLYLITECLRHWVLHYHIDGFRVNQEVMPAYAMASDPILCKVKLMINYWDENMLAHHKLLDRNLVLMEYNDGFMNDVRRYLKGDEGMVEAFSRRMLRNPKQCSVVNYITQVNGFTMMDLVSYDVKHNESNGEHNIDGTDYNYSWNCGVEGKSRKKAVVEKRRCQIRNAFFMLLASQGTPMILAGDEFGNSQEGNNNPYCQDNSITWLNWNQIKTNQDIFQYVKTLIDFRKKHPVLHRHEQMRMIDTLACGFPDVSLHGTKAWYADFSPYNRMLGVLFCGQYAKLPDGGRDRDIFIAYNMHWNPQSFDLPNLSEDRQWNLYLDTYENVFHEIVPKKSKPKSKAKRKKASLAQQKKTVVPPRSIVVYLSD